MTRLAVATRSVGKLRELLPMLAAAGYAPVDLGTLGIAATAGEEALEVHATFRGNALAKARYFHALTGLPTLADDSGLCVDALGGAPGVRSKRWSGRTDLTGQALDDANTAAVLVALGPGGERACRYACAAAYVDGEREAVGEGAVAGRLLEAPQGAGGFGYDPYFWCVELGRGFGEVSREEKATVSHRARAVAALLSALRAGG